jgi:hypothetical protein
MSRRFARVLVLALVLFALVVAASSQLGCSAELGVPPLDDAGHGASRQTGSPQPPRNPSGSAGGGRRVAAPGGYKGALPPIPESPYAAAAPDVIRAIYEFAARRPDVLRYVPCFCGCERNGHQDNEDCFVAKRGVDGRPQWDDHGLT